MLKYEKKNVPTGKIGDNRMKSEIDHLEKYQPEKVLMEEPGGIAVIGMSCRFPGANNLQEFWNNLKNGIESVTFFSDQELLESGINPSFLNDQRYVKAGCIIDDIDRFDNELFEYSPHEVEMIDPQQRFFLVCARECLEDAGYVSNSYDGRIGVFGGMRLSSYYSEITAIFPWVGTTKGFQTLMGNDKDYLATRVSYKLNLKGPSVSVQTACSTSLVAVHLAVESLGNGECDMALAGGAAITIPQKQGYFYQEGMAFSSDGHCRAFEANGQGIIGGNGVGVVLLKPLKEALADRDNIYAVIKGTAVNNDGKAKAGFTAPSIEGQTEIIAEALAMADVKVEDITYIETHGTGTPLGDPIEIEALTRVFREETGKKGFCAIGSVKTNVGHLDSVAGICSFIKTVLALKHKQIPPALNFEKPNPKIHFKDTPFFVNTQLRNWKRAGSLLTAGVNSFGVGGTNVHVVLQEHQDRPGENENEDSSYHVLTMSAQNEKSLTEYAKKYREFFTENQEVRISDTCFTANTGREHFSHRLAITTDTVKKAAKMIDTFLEGEEVEGLAYGNPSPKNKEKKLVFLYTETGPQFFNMGAALYRTQPIFKREIDKCADILSKYMDKPLLEILYHVKAGEETIINRTQYAQPGLFAVEYALTMMLQSWGIKPSAVMGHSLGEYTAACVAGVFSLEHGLKLVAARAHLMQKLTKKGTMAAVVADKDLVTQAISDYQGKVSIAAFNTPRLTVISGLTDCINKITRQLRNKKIEIMIPNVYSASHSPLIEPIISSYRETLHEITYHAPAIEVVSNVTGNFIKDNELQNPDYWCKHSREPVNFTESIKSLAENGYRFFLEIGPGQSLSQMSSLCVEAEQEYDFVSTLKNLEDWKNLLNAVGILYTRGFDIDWDKFHDRNSRNRVSIPTYPLARKRFWNQSPMELISKSPAKTASILEIVRKDLRAHFQDKEPGIKDRYDKGNPLLAKLCGFYIGRALRSLGAFIQEDDAFSLEKFLFQTPVMPKYRQFLHWLLQGMVNAGFLDKDNNEYKNLKLIPDEEFDRTFQVLKEIGLLPGNDTVIKGIQQCGKNLGNILSGEEEITNVLYPDHSFEFLEELYRNTAFSTYYNDVIKAVINSISINTPQDTRIRILEVGGGAGDSAKDILPSLAKERFSYTFTGLFSSFLDGPKRDRGSYSLVRLETLDLLRDPGEQGFQENQFDIIIASHSLYMIPDTRKALKNLESLLAPQGIFLVREPGEYHLLYTMLFGSLIPEIDDDELRGNHPFLSAAKWREILIENGFKDTFLLADNQIGSEQIIIAQKPKAVHVPGAEAFTIPVRETGKTLPGSDLSKKHPLLEQRYPTALPLFETQLNCEKVDFIADHKVYGAILVAGTVFFEMGNAAVKEVFGTDNVMLQDLNVLEPLIFPDLKETRTLQVIFTHQSYKDAAFKIFSFDNQSDKNAGNWKLHCSGSARRKASQKEWIIKEKPGLNDIRKRCTEAVSVSEFYEDFRRNGLEIEFPGVKKLWKGDKESLGLIELPAPFKNPGEYYHSHPVLLDSSMLISRVTLPQELFTGENKESSGYLLAGIEAMNFGQSPLPHELWSYARLRETNENTWDTFAVDYFLYDMDDHLVGEIVGMRMKRAPMQIIRQDTDIYKADDLFYEVQWIAEPDFLAPQKEIKGTWLLLSDDTGLGQSLRAALENKGINCIVVKKGDDFQCVDPMSYIINPTEPGNFKSLINHVSGEKGVPCDGIIHLWALDTPGKDLPDLTSLQEYQRVNLSAVLYLIQTAAAAKWLEQVSLYIVTKNSLYVPSNYSPEISLMQSTLWGLGKVVDNEYPGLRCVMADLEDVEIEKNKDSLLQMLQWSTQESQVVWRNSVLYVPRLVRSDFPSSSASQLSPLNSESTYLLPGGLGGIGLALARWLATNGARHLLMVSRSNPSEKAQQALLTLKNDGVKVTLVQADVGNKNDVEEKIRPVLENMPLLRGVFYLAGAVDDGVLARQSWEKFEKVLNPKVYGAWNIHELVKESALDFFVLFSSASSIFGNAGQGNYSAANSFLDGLACYRQQKGLPALSINWGLWGEIGFAAEQNLVENLENVGMLAIKPGPGFELLKKAMSGPKPQIAIMSIDWQKLNKSFPGLNQLPFFSAIAEQTPDAAGTPAQESAVLKEILNVKKEDRRGIIKDYLVANIADMLRIYKEELSVEADFFQLGLDSLQFLELSQILTRDLQVKITTAEAYDNPTIQSLVERIQYEIDEKISDNAKGIPDQNAGLDPVSAVGGEIVPGKENKYEPFDLTNVQYAYWVGRRGVLELGNVSCHFYFEVDNDNLDIERFNRALQLLIQRHDMLRAVILPEAKQKILKEVPPFRARENDFSDLKPGDVEACLMKVRENMSHQVISEEWPLFDIRVSILPGNRFRMHFSIDLMIVDAISIQIIFNDIAAFLKNPGYEPEPIEISFRDYVLTEIAFRNTDFYKQCQEYWLNRIPHLPGPPELPKIKNPKSLNAVEQRFTSRTFHLDEATWGQIKENAKKHGLTPTGLLLTAYGDILSLWSKNSRFIISLTQFNRIPFHPRINEIIGDFTCINVMTLGTTPGNTFAQRAKETQKELWNCIENRYFDGISVLREMARGKRTDEPLVPVVFTSVLAYTGENAEYLYPWEILGEMGYFVSQTPQVWLDNQVSERKGCLVVNWDAVDQIFPAGLIEDMIEAYKNLLVKLANKEDAWDEFTIADIPGRQKKTLSAVNSTGREISKEMLHTLFTQQVEKRKENLAVITPVKEITYEELDTLSDHAAYILRELGVKPNSFVAVVMEKGWEQVPAVLGTIKAGAAYLPIDAAVPGERLRYLLQDAEVRVVLTQSWFENKIQWPDSVKVISMDKLTGTKIKPKPPAVVQAAEDIAYVIYTSGSTGVPKGVVIDHRGAVNTILDINQRFHVHSDDRVLALSALSFDLSVYDIFGMLAAGGSMVIPEAGKEKDPGHWWELLETRQITLWDSVPALMQMLVEYTSGIPQDIPQSLRLVLLSGDWIPLHLPDQVRDLFKNADLISLGGATEASIWSILYPIKEIDPGWKSIPYGKPMWNQRFYVLDDQMRLCPQWVPGQLFIGGIGLAKDYWHDEEKTNKSFIIHPDSGERLYKTGDLGRYLPDGNIEFLGREDFQVKIRGHRIELGEIEENLKKHPGVQDAVVLALGEPMGDKQLVGCIVCDQEKTSLLFEEENADPDEIKNRWTSLVETGRKQSHQIVELKEFQGYSAFMTAAEKLSIVYICRVLKNFGAFSGSREKHTLESLMEKCQIQPRYRKLFGRWLTTLVKEGLLKEEDDAFISSGSLPGYPSEELWQEIELNANWDQAQVLLRYLKSSCENHIPLLKGEIDPLELFFPEGSWDTAESIYKFNPEAQYHNAVVREILRPLVESWPEEKELRILEVGAGTGSTTASILPVLPPDGIIYTYTDLSDFFLTKAREKFKDFPFIQYKFLDIDRDPQLQGYNEHVFDVVIAANVLHDARDIHVSLKYILSLLAPGGLLLNLEATRSSRGQMISVGFLEGLSHFEDGRLKENLPLLSMEKWREYLLASGFEDFAAFPESGYLSEVFLMHTMVAQAPSSTKRFKPARLRDFLQKNLPDYMTPSRYILMDALPLTPNGKIDRKALPLSDIPVSFESKSDNVVPRTQTEKAIAEIWSEILKIEHLSIDDDFLAIGGDSLQAVQVINKLREKYSINIPLRIIFEQTSISKMANFIETAVQTKKEENEFEEGVI
jgi:amino acid adenylation domain-containing protein